MIIESNEFLLTTEIKIDGLEIFERRAIMHHLRELNLVDVWQNKAFIITLKGIEAHKMGIDKYLEELKDKEKLETKLTVLEVENLEYRETIRERESKIIKLDLKLKRLEWIQKWWWLLGIILLIIGRLSNLL